MAKIVATFICLCFALIGRTDLRAAAAKPRVVIAHAAMNFRVAPLWVAQDQGFFSKYGIDSEVIYMRGGPTLLSGMLSVDIQVGWTASGITRRYQRALTSLSSPDSTTGLPTS
jgi:ABC-type nitrate/sulfonate/bicarbonate transport system substrate-binding protein